MPSDVALRATILGARGSLAIPGEATVGFGGNTPCIEVRTPQGGLLVLDAGTGIKQLGAALEHDGPVHVLLTHLHLDHVEGLRFFAPLWRPGAEVHIWGPASATHSLEERIARAFSPPLFPLELVDVPARISFHDVPDRTWELEGVRIDAATVLHPGPTLGFRLSFGGRTIAYIPDHEPAHGVDLAGVEPRYVSGRTLAQDVDLLFHDAQLSESEYPARVGWGHSSVAHAVEFAQLSNVNRLVLFHHDPDRSDDEVDALVERACELWNGGAGDLPVAAREGMTFELALGDDSSLVSPDDRAPRLRAA
jgi:phosphoribosyl 1,2-cyclic phosphodiesterase